MSLELTPRQLKRHFDIDRMGVKDTEKLDHLTGIIGQERAVESLQFGLNIKGVGFNTYVAGPPGIGKMTSVKSFIEKVASKKETPPDWCYVNNFSDSYNPKVIQLPAGKGCDLKKDMEYLVEHIQQELPKSFESDDYNARKDEIMNNLNQKREELSRELNNRANEEGFTIQPSPVGIMIIPVKDGEPLKDSEFQSLSEDERNEIQEKREKIQNDMKGAMKKIRKIENEAQNKVKELDQRVALNSVGGVIDDLMEKYSDYEKVKKYLEDVQDDILDNLDMFKQNSAEKKSELPVPQLKQQQQKMLELSLRKYTVNVTVDNSKQEGAPVIVEYNPTYNNLIGRIEKEMQMGALTTDFSMIRAGSILKANGGFLVLPVEDVLRGIYSYDGLKRTLRSGKIHIEELGEKLGYMTVKTIRPEPIPVDVKVVLVGSPFIYYLLQQYDEDFQELFKVKADFDTQMDINDENIGDFMSFISTYCHKEELRHLAGDAIRKLLEHAARMAGDQKKLSIKFGLLADILREADFWAGQNGSSLVNGEDVQKALDHRIYRSNLIQKRIQEMIERGTLLIDTDGKKVGQVNGLSVINLGNYMFGKPNRITATVSPGREGIVDIEREVKLGGPIHSKGVLILSGYLNQKYMNNSLLTLSAKVVFEQSYQGVEGDSASSAELYAILSMLADAPIRQNIAVTGSVNQHGEVQAIGGVNEKIEGFFDVCQTNGLTGEQGVIIPDSNKKNLMLREEVIKAIEDNKFHVWAITTIDQGIEILTGIPAGERQADGSFPKNTLNEKIESRLKSYEKSLKELSISQIEKHKEND
ncbi:AAA family ATPase [candidate division KSB1 bacterium]|nr:AAA family ATPase [candidate division KSB1 bacterium]